MLPVNEAGRCDPDKGPRPDAALGHLAVAMLSCDLSDFRDFSPGSQLVVGKSRHPVPHSCALVSALLLEG